jgi:uncharacterized protein YuzE
MATAEYDRAADALYIRLAPGDVARTVEIDQYRVLDIDENGRALGLEVLYPASNLQIAPIARAWGFDDQLAAIDEAIEGALGSAPPARVTVTMAWRIGSQLPGNQNAVVVHYDGVTRTRDTSSSSPLLVTAA